MTAVAGVTLDELVDDTLNRLYRIGDRPRMVEVGSNGLDSPTDTQMLLVDGEDVAATDVLEAGYELMLVRSKDASTVRVVRGYATTPVQQLVASGTLLRLNPSWTRWEVRRAVLAGINGPISQVVPEIVTESMTTRLGSTLIELPPQTLGVHRVGFYDEDGGFTDLSQWEFLDVLPPEVSSTGRAVRVTPLAGPDDQLAVTYTVPWRWWDGATQVPASEVSGSSEVRLPAGAADLPVFYASAFLAGGREISRIQLDRVEEWNYEQAARQGVNVRLLRELWGDFYRRLEETRRTYQPPKHRPFVKMRRGI